MNNQYQSFWQNTFTELFNADAQTKNVTKALNQTLSKLDEFTSLFNNSCNTDFFESSTNFIKNFDFSTEEYIKSFNNYMELFGLISIDEYRSLIKKYDKLKKDNKADGNKGDAQKKKITELTKTVKSQDGKITSQTKTIQECKSEITKSKKTMAAQQKTITDLEKKLTTADAKKKTTPKAKTAKK